MQEPLPAWGEVLLLQQAKRVELAEKLDSPGGSLPLPPGARPYKGRFIWKTFPGGHRCQLQYRYLFVLINHVSQPVLAYLALPSIRQVLGCAHDSATVPGKIILLVILLVEMDFPIIEVDFLNQPSVMADPANSRLVSAQVQRHHSLSNFLLLVDQVFFCKFLEAISLTLLTSPSIHPGDFFYHSSVQNCASLLACSKYPVGGISAGVIWRKKYEKEEEKKRKM